MSMWDEYDDYDPRLAAPPPEQILDLVKFLDNDYLDLLADPMFRGMLGGGGDWNYDAFQPIRTPIAMPVATQMEMQRLQNPNSLEGLIANSIMSGDTASETRAMLRNLLTGDPQDEETAALKASLLQSADKLLGSDDMGNPVYSDVVDLRALDKRVDDQYQSYMDEQIKAQGTEGAIFDPTTGGFYTEEQSEAAKRFTDLGLPLPTDQYSTDMVGTPAEAIAMHREQLYGPARQLSESIRRITGMADQYQDDLQAQREAERINLGEALLRPGVSDLDDIGRRREELADQVRGLAGQSTQPGRSIQDILAERGIEIEDEDQDLWPTRLNPVGLRPGQTAGPGGIEGILRRRGIGTEGDGGFFDQLTSAMTAGSEGIRGMTRAESNAMKKRARDTNVKANRQYHTDMANEDFWNNDLGFTLDDARNFGRLWRAEREGRTPLGDVLNDAAMNAGMPSRQVTRPVADSFENRQAFAKAYKKAVYGR